LSEKLDGDGSLPVVRLLHTSDIHVSGDAGSLDALAAVVTAAVESDVDVVIIAGDLFDSSRVPEPAVERTITELARVGRPVVVIPGNHDCVDERSIYHRVNLLSAGGHVRFAGDPAGEELRFDELSLVVWARGIESHDPDNRPLAGYEPADPGVWSVVVTHGHYVGDGEQSDRSSQISQAEIRQLRCHYLALGHWHRFLDVSEPGVQAYYSGSPWEPWRDASSVNLVTLHPDEGVRVERRMLEHQH